MSDLWITATVLVLVVVLALALRVIISRARVRREEELAAVRLLATLAADRQLRQQTHEAMRAMAYEVRRQQRW